MSDQELFRAIGRIEEGISALQVSVSDKAEEDKRRDRKIEELMTFKARAGVYLSIIAVVFSSVTGVVIKVLTDKVL